MPAHKCQNQKLIDDIEKDMYGDGNKMGVKYEMITIKTKMNLLVWINTAVLIAVTGAIIKIVFA